MLGQRMQTNQAPESCLLLLLVHIDDFHKYRGIYGRQTSDRVLYGVARILREQIGAGETLARYENDLVAMLPLHSRTAQEVARRLREAVTEASTTVQVDSLSA